MIFDLEPYNKNVSEEDIILDFQRIAKKIGKNSVTQREYQKLGKYSVKTVYNKFGSWKTITEKSNLTFRSNTGQSFTNEELFENIKNVWIKLGRQPKYNEVIHPLSKFHAATYERRFGGWRKALEAFITYINTEDQDDVSLVSSNSKESKRKTSRTINLRLRFIVMRRDDFKCRICGKSPANNPGTELEVDHIIPWSKGGETVIDNLQTLCFECNQGKSNLDLKK